MSGSAAILKAIAGFGLPNLLGPLLLFISTPVLARVYSSAQLGDFYLASAVASIASILISGQLHLGLMSTRSLRRSMRIYSETVIISVFVATLFCIFVLLVTALKFDSEAPGTFSPAMVAVTAVYTLTLAWSQITLLLLARLKWLGLYSGSLALRAIVIVLVQLGLPMLTGASQTVYLFAGVISGELIVFLVGFLRIRSIGGLRLPAWNLARLEVRHHVGFLKFFLPSQCIGLGANILPYVLLRYLGMKHSVAEFGVLSRILQTPISAFTEGVRTTFWVGLRDRPQTVVWRSATLLFTALFLITAATATLYRLLDLALIEWFLGSSWSDIDRLAPYFILWVGVSAATVFPLEIVKHTGRQHLVLVCDVVSAVFKIGYCVIAAILQFDRPIEFFCLVGATTSFFSGVCYLSNIRRNLPRVPGAIAVGL